MKKILAFAGMGLCAAFSIRAQTLDQRVQAPSLAPPERGSLAGQLASVAFGPADVSRGGFSLASPFDVPSERGSPLAPIFPSYSPDAGVSEWGVGWQSNLTIARWRVTGDLDYATDELSSPWGHCHRGADGFWYPTGLSSAVRIQPTVDGFVAYLPDGAQWIFGGIARVQNGAGTYAWHLRQVVSALGRKTNLAWTANTSGRLFLTSVDYGGIGDETQARVQIGYETLAQPFADLRSGARLDLDRRVSTVSVTVKNAATGLDAPRWSYALTYLQDPVGPAFYLARIQQTFASGERPPAVSYDYQLSGEVLQAAALMPVPAFDAVIAQFGSGIALPDQSTALDADQDGFIDLETATDNSLLWQTQQGFTVQSLPANPNALPECRAAPSILNPPRSLAQMRAGDPSVQVVSLVFSPATQQTNLTLCTRGGDPTYLTTLFGFWQLGPNTRLVDLNRDLQPDLIQVYRDGYEVIPNRSTSAGYAFGPPVFGMLHLDLDPVATWVQDFNGDGIPDLIVRSDPYVLVYLGSGNFAFAPEPLIFTVNNGTGFQFDTTGYQFTFVDANSDGLADLLLSASDGSVFLALNSGDGFFSVDVPALVGTAFDFGLPMFIDVAGSGEAEVLFTAGGSARSLALSSPGTGLLRTADDGKGTMLRFAYARAPAAPGQRQRHRLLSSLRVESTGSDAQSYGFSYGTPVLHSIGKFLVGYGRVVRTDALVTRTVDFVNGDDAAGLLGTSVVHDQNAPNVVAFETRTYDDALTQGLSWKRLRTAVSGWQAAGGRQVSKRVDYLAYTADVCPSRIQQQDEHGTLLTVDTRAGVASLANSLHCLAAQTQVSGSHSDPSLDFNYLQLFDRNAVGQVTAITSRSGGESLVLQAVAYNGDFTIASISSPGRGTSVFTYDSTTHLLGQITAPDGSITRAASRDSITDSLLTLTVDRGGGLYQRFYRYDGQERLAKHWDSLGSASELNPDQTFAYRTATATLPGTVSITTLADGTNAGIAKQEVDYLTAGGASITAASRIPEGWTFGEVEQRLVSMAQTIKLRKATAPTTTEPLAVAYADLLADGQQVASSRASVHGHLAERRTKLHADVEQLLSTDLKLPADRLTRNTLENGAFGTTELLDADLRLVQRIDEAQVATSWVYDALGRLRDVVLPGNVHHRRDYDGHGRVSSVRRDGVASIAWSYAPVTGLVASQTFSSPAGALLRQVAYGYDAIGRKTSETHTDLSSTLSQTYRFFWDGASPAAPSAVGLRGFVTGVSGDGFTKQFDYRPDGLLAHRAASIAGWRTVDTTLDYFDDGTIRTKTTLVKDSGGQVLSTQVERFAVDAWGRVQSLQLNGAPAASFSYDVNGQLASVAFGAGGSASISYEPLTRVEVGISEAGTGWSSSTSVRYDNRGLPESESISVGATSLSRAYGYSPQRFLSASSDAQSSYSYGFDPVGLSTFVQKGTARTQMVQSGAQVSVGPVTYGFDALGRVTDKGDLHLTYGPNGQISQAQRSANVWTFIADESGHRLAKLVGGQPVYGAFDEGYLDAGGLTEPLVLSGMVVGIIRSGTARPLPLDTRGTLLGDSDGTPRIASPFGARDVHPDLAPAIDYVRQGYDADLGVLRMGVRDYDPALNRFLTPDPLFLEQPERCGGELADCNLYAYARNAPTLYVDRNGHLAHILVGAGIGGAISVGAYLIFTPRSEWTVLGAGGAFAGGALSGGIAAATGGASLLWQSAASAGGSLAGGVVTRAIESGGDASATFDTKKMAFDTLGGAVGPALGKAVGFLRGSASRAAVSAEEAAVGRAVGRAPTPGATTVYRAVDQNGTTIYVGITDDIKRRGAEHLREKGIIIKAIPGLEGISRSDAQAVEQVLIEHYGRLNKQTGTLLNKINSISPENPIYKGAAKAGKEILDFLGYQR